LKRSYDEYRHDPLKQGMDKAVSQFENSRLPLCIGNAQLAIRGIILSRGVCIIVFTPLYPSQEPSE